ncbi:serine/threonine kinase [Aureococcus anophagefferens]|nr:serine/threonine kinase [Aureococcus anophagefferens]
MSDVVFSSTKRAARPPGWKPPPRRGEKPAAMPPIDEAKSVAGPAGEYEALLRKVLADGLVHFQELGVVEDFEKRRGLGRRGPERALARVDARRVPAVAGLRRTAEPRARGRHRRGRGARPRRVVRGRAGHRAARADARAPGPQVDRRRLLAERREPARGDAEAAGVADAAAAAAEPGAAASYAVDELAAATDQWAPRARLGGGGFGDVFRGALRGGDVAIKRVHAQSLQGLREFEAEIRALGKLRDPSLVRLLGHGRRGAGDFCLGDGEKCFIHGDVKTANILLTSAGGAKLADFGLVRELAKGATHVGTTSLTGSWGYICPAFARTGRVAPSTDVFAFGVVLLEVLTGLPAIDGDRAGAGPREAAKGALTALVGHLEAHLESHSAVPEAGIGHTRMGMRLLVYARRDAGLAASEVCKDAFTAGGIFKGALTASMLLAGDGFEERFVFTTAHLPAHEGRAEKRNAALARIRQRVAKTMPSPASLFVFGDLNYRSNPALDLGRRAPPLDGDGGSLATFASPPCRFPPTFKVAKKRGFFYLNSRLPSYTDRILYGVGRGGDRAGGVRRGGDVCTSDHKPLRGCFEVALGGGDAADAAGTARRRPAVDDVRHSVAMPRRPPPPRRARGSFMLPEDRRPYREALLRAKVTAGVELRKLLESGRVEGTGMERIGLRYHDASYDFCHMMTAIHEQCAEKTSFFAPGGVPGQGSAETPPEAAKPKPKKFWNPLPLTKLKPLAKSPDEKKAPDAADADAAGEDRAREKEKAALKKETPSRSGARRRRRPTPTRPRRPRPRRTLARRPRTRRRRPK